MWLNRLELILPQASPPPRPPRPPTCLHSSQPPYALAVSTRAPRSEGEHGSLLIFCGRRDDKFCSHISLFIRNSPRAAGGLRSGGAAGYLISLWIKPHAKRFLLFRGGGTVSSCFSWGLRRRCWWEQHRRDYRVSVSQPGRATKISGGSEALAVEKGKKIYKYTIIHLIYQSMSYCLYCRHWWRKKVTTFLVL